MLKFGRASGLLVSFLLLAFTAAGAGTVVQLRAVTPTSAIDTLTMTSNPASGEAAVTTDSVIFPTLPTDTEDSLRNRIIALGGVQAPTFTFTNNGGSRNQLLISANSGGVITSLQLNGADIPIAPAERASKGGFRFFLPRTGSGTANRIPALTPLGMAILILLLAATALYLFFRKRAPKAA